MSAVSWVNTKANANACSVNANVSANANAKKAKAFQRPVFPSRGHQCRSGCRWKASIDRVLRLGSNCLLHDDSEHVVVFHELHHSWPRNKEIKESEVKSFALIIASPVQKWWVYMKSCALRQGMLCYASSDRSSDDSLCPWVAKHVLEKFREATMIEWSSCLCSGQAFNIRYSSLDNWRAITEGSINNWSGYWVLEHYI